MAQNLGKIEMDPKGLRDLAFAIDTIYGEYKAVFLSVWKDDTDPHLFFQLAEGTGKIELRKGD